MFIGKDKKLKALDNLYTSDKFEFYYFDIVKDFCFP